jgi:hypothetical protein
MQIRAYIQFYKDIIPYVLIFTILSKILFGSMTAIIIFLNIGIGIGFLAFSLIKKQEFYFYYNLGITKWKQECIYYQFNYWNSHTYFILFNSFINFWRF